MIKEAIITVLIGGAGTGALYVGDTRYVKQETFENAVKQQRSWELQDRIDRIRGKAKYEDRDLTPFEEQEINNLQQQIRRLGV
jgi:hypothetical protein